MVQALESKSLTRPCWEWLAPWLACGFIFLVYAPGLRNGFVYDDHEVILRQHPEWSIRQLLAVFSEPHFCDLPYYRPVTRATLLFQKLVHGDHALPFHFVNILLMTVAFALAYLLISSPFFGVSRLLAAAVALVFAIHPVASECVYPAASGRETLLPTVFVLASVCSFQRAGKIWRLLSLFFFSLAVLSKESAIASLGLLVVIELSGCCCRSRGRTIRRSFVTLLPFVGVATGYMLLRLGLFGGKEFQFAFLSDPWGVPASLLYAFQVVVAPFWQLVYEPNIAHWASPPRIAAVAISLILLIHSYQEMATVEKRAVGFWLAWIMISLLSTANVLVQEARFAERYAFQASLGIIGLFAAMTSSTPRLVRGKSGVTIVVMLVLAVGVISMQRARYYRDSETFCRQWLAVDPEAVNPRIHLGWLMLEEGKPDRAADYLLEAQVRGPQQPRVMELLSHARLRQGRTTEAIALASRALELEPDSIGIRYALGSALHAVSQADLAAARYREILALDAAQTEARYNLAVILTEQDEADEAEAEYLLVLEHAPNHGPAHANLGRLLAKRKRLSEAADHYQLALKIQPEDAQTHGNLANVLAVQGDLYAAQYHYETVLRLVPNSAEAHFNMGVLAQRRGKMIDACNHYRSALRIRPDWTEPKVRLAWVFATNPVDDPQEEEEAVRLASDACRLTAYSDVDALDTLAAAYAAAGRFTEAVRFASEALALAEAGPHSHTAVQIRQRLDLYRQDTPYRDAIWSEEPLSGDSKPEKLPNSAQKNR